MTQESLTFEVAWGGVSKTSFCTAVSVPSISKASFRSTAPSKPTNLPDPHSPNHLMYMLEPDGAMDDQTVDIPYDDKLSRITKLTGDPSRLSNHSVNVSKHLIQLAYEGSHSDQPENVIHCPDQSEDAGPPADQKVNHSPRLDTAKDVRGHSDVQETTIHHPYHADNKDWPSDLLKNDCDYPDHANNVSSWSDSGELEKDSRHHSQSEITDQQLNQLGATRQHMDHSEILSHFSYQTTNSSLNMGKTSTLTIHQEELNNENAIHHPDMSENAVHHSKQSENAGQSAHLLENGSHHSYLPESADNEPDQSEYVSHQRDLPEYTITNYPDQSDDTNYPEQSENTNYPDQSENISYPAQSENTNYPEQSENVILSSDELETESGPHGQS